MYKTLFAIGSYEVNSWLVFSIISLIVFLYLLWVHQKRISRNEDTFDVAFFGVFFGLLFARVIGFLSNLDKYGDYYFSINPFFDTEGVFSPLSTLPWAFFKVWDGNLYLSILPVGLVLGVWIISKSKRAFVRARVAIDNTVMALIPSQMIFIAGMLFAGLALPREYNGIFSVPIDGARRFPMQPIEIALLLVTYFIIYQTNSRYKYGLPTAYYLLIQGLGQFALRFMASDYLPTLAWLDFGHILAIFTILLSVIFFLKGTEDVSTEQMGLPADYNRGRKMRAAQTEQNIFDRIPQVDRRQRMAQKAKKRGLLSIFKKKNRGGEP